MRLLIAFLFCFLFSTLFISRTVNPEEVGIDDLLIPQRNLQNNKDKDTTIENQKINEQIIIDELLGPPDIFPFLPENHKNSGIKKLKYFD